MNKDITIWAHCLVKNEERWIWFALQSVLPFVDKILVWDTGSTDRTVAIIKSIKSIKSKKISFKSLGKIEQSEFGRVRNKMIRQSKGDWILILDGDEIWPRNSLQALILAIHKAPRQINTISVRPINFVGDINFIHPEVFLGQTPYGPKGLKGFFSNRAFRRYKIGLYAKGAYGQEGFYDKTDKTLVENTRQVQYLAKVYYWHMSYLPRSSCSQKDFEVMMRRNKRKFEIGLPRPKWIRIPEVFYLPRPAGVTDPFYQMDQWSYLKASLQTPLKKIKRKLTKWKKD